MIPIHFHLTPKEAAAIWANNWKPKDKTISQLIGELAHANAQSACRAFPDTIKQDTEEFLATMATFKESPKGDSTPRAASRTRWTQAMPDRDGWWWHRHVVGSIPTDQPLNVMLMTGQKVHSVCWRGRWRLITELPSGPRWQWSDTPIQAPTGHLFGAENDQVELPPNGGSESKKDAPGG